MSETVDSDIKKDMKRDKMSNPMRQIYIDKVVINIGVGESGEKLRKAETVIELLTGRKKSIRTIAKKTAKELGIRKGMPIGCKVTLRGELAEDFLRNALWVKNNQLAHYSFDPEGNVSFGISDYTDFKDQKYNPDIGIFGMDINVVFKRKGARVERRRRCRRKIPKRHRLTPQEVMNYLKDKFNVEVL